MFVMVDSKPLCIIFSWCMHALAVSKHGLFFGDQGLKYHSIINSQVRACAREIIHKPKPFQVVHLLYTLKTLSSPFNPPLPLPPRPNYEYVTCNNQNFLFFSFWWRI